MFRKNERAYKVRLRRATPWTELTRSVEHDTNRVMFSEIHCAEVSNQQLDPDVVVLDSLLERGIKIDPKQIRSYLNPTDIADIERFNSERTAHLYQYLQDNEEEILSQIKPSNSAE